MRSGSLFSHRTQHRRLWRRFSAALAFLLVLASGVAARAESLPTITFENPPYPLGTIHNQDGWSSSGSAGAGSPGFDHAVSAVNAEVQAIAPQFGSQALRISSAVASGSFGNHTFSKSLENEAGETSAVSDGQSGGTRQNHFEAEWEFISTTPSAPQTGLSVVASPDRGDGARMSWIQMTDTAAGININFNDYQRTLPGPNKFVERPVATGLPRNAVYKIKITMDFVDGPANDIVRVYLDDTLVLTGTSWEDYFREQESNPTRPVDSILFRTSVAGGTSGEGFYIDNLKLSSSMASPVSTVYVRTDGDDFACDGTTDASAASSPEGKCAFKTIARGYSGVDSGGTVNIAAGTYAEAITVVNKPVTFSGAGVGQTIMDGGNSLTSAFASTVPFSNVTIQDLTIQKYAQQGIHFLTGPLANIKLEDLEIKQNGSHGFWSQAFGIDGFTINRVNASENTGAGARGVWFINGEKKNFTITNSTFSSNAVVGLDLADGTLENAVITDNIIENNGDSGMGVLGAKTSLSVKNNTLTNNGRFGIEIKNPDGPTSGTTNLVVEQNTVTRNQVATDAAGRDYAGIAVFRRDPVTTQSALQPAGVLIQNNVVTGYQRKPSSNSDGFGIVVAGANIQVKNNVLDSNDIGIQIQAGNPAADNSAVVGTDWFDRDSASSFSGSIQHNDIKKTNAIGLRAVGTISNGDVTQNWWGASSGPQITGNAGATGAPAAVSNGATITYSPFLGHGTDTAPATIGFQPDLATYTTRHVNLNGSDTECDGTSDAVFSAEALGFCAVATGQKAANLASNGHTVQFAAGTWTKSAGQIIVTEVKALTIQGAGRAQTIIDGQDGAGKTVGRGIGFNTGGTNGVTIKNLTVRNFEQHGIYGQGPITNFTVDNVESSDNGANTANGKNARGVAVWGFAKDGITITNSIFNRNGLERNPGIGVMDGSATNVTITGNHVEGNSDDGIFAIGLGGPGANLIANNTVINNGRFGIDIALPNGSGAESGPGSIVVEGNTVSRTIPATITTDHAGIVVMRRSSYITAENLDFSHGVVIRNNVVSGFRANAPGSTGEGFCIVVEGTGMSVHNNAVSDCDVGIQMQKGNTADVQDTPGFDRGDATDFSGTVEQNSIATSNTVGMRGVGLTTAADASHNWWGNASGPTHASNTGGTGASVVGDNIAFSPWLADGTDTSASIGFQPNLTPLGFLPTQGINVAPTSGLVTTENGGTAKFSVSLASQPSANVTIPLSSSNTNEGTVSPTSLTFTPANFAVPQEVTVTGNALAPNNGNVAYTIITGQASSTDDNFNGIDPADVSVTNNASAVPAINVAPTSGLVTTENGGTAQFAVVLAAVPSANVTVPLSSSNTNEGTVSPSSLTFTPQNWNTPQTVTVTGNAAAPNNGNVAYTIVTGAATSADPAYNGLNPADVSVTNNAAAVPAISIADASVVEGNAGNVALVFTVSLSQTSPNPVTVTYATQDQSAVAGPTGDYFAVNGVLTFNPGETTKEIRVQVRIDNLFEQDETLLVILSNATGGTIADGQAVGTITNDDLDPTTVGPQVQCSPRPEVTVQTQAIGGRQLQVTIRSNGDGLHAGNTVQRIQFGALTNATVQMQGQASVGTDPIVLPPGTRQIVFTVTQTTPGVAFHAPFKVTDMCGEIQKFVGGGKDSID